jgi:hypothetical protein
VQPDGRVVRRQEERRAWQRVVPKESRATLSWGKGADLRTVAGEVLDLSGGGAAVRVDVLPPQEEPIRLSLGPAPRADHFSLYLILRTL